MTNTDEVAEQANASQPQEETPDTQTSNPEESEPVTDHQESTDLDKEYLEEVETDNTDWKKRYSDSTREYQKLRQEQQQYAKAIENLERFAKTNPRILEEIEAAQRQMPVGQTVDPSSLQSQIDQALEPIKKVAAELQQKDRETKGRVLTDFEKKNPDLFPVNATIEQKRSIRQKIGKVAGVLVESGMDFNEAINRAYLTINPKAAIQKGRDEAYLEAQTESQAGFTSQSSTDTRQTKKVKYSKAELDNAKKLGDKYYKAMLED